MTHSITAADRTKVTDCRDRPHVDAPRLTRIAAGAELGLPEPFDFWVNGRAGVLGAVDADVAAAAICFMAPRRGPSSLGVADTKRSPPRCAPTAYVAGGGRLG